MNDPCYTRYQLEVTQTIKGDLQPGDEIQAKKLGYYDSESDIYYMVPDDIYPEEGDEYLFLASLNPDSGLYTIVAPYTTIPLSKDIAAISTYSGEETFPGREAVIEEYTEAYQNEEPYQWPGSEIGPS